MIALFVAELRKLWGNRLYRGMLAALVAANLMLLWMGTQPSAKRPAPAAYKTVGQLVCTMTMEQAGEWLGGQLQTAEDLLTIDRYHTGDLYGLTPAQYREEYAGAFLRTEQIYADRAYTLYTGNFRTEVLLMRQLWDEYCAVRDYPQFLQEIQTKAEQLSGISIFQNGGDTGYNSKVIRATADAYAQMQQIPLLYYPQQGVYTALQYPFTDIILLAAMLLLALFIVRHERDSTLLHLIRTLPGGRLRTALAKLLAFTVSLLAVLFLLYGANLAYCAVAFGLGPLHRSIQTVPALIRCTLQVNTAQYLVLFLLAKWAAAFVLGLWVLFAALVARRQLTGWLLALLLPLGMYGVRMAVPAAGHWNVLKYANLISLLQTNELLGRYRCLYWFGSPVPLSAVEWSAAVLFGVLFGGLFCLFFARGMLGEAARRTGACLHRQKTRATSVWKEEGYKLWRQQGAAVILAAFVAFGVYQGVTAESYINAEEYFYARYLKPVSGPYTEESREKLIEMGEEFIPLVQALERAESGKSEDADVVILGSLMQKYQVYTRVVSQNVNTYLSRHPQAWLVYDTGYKKLFGLSGSGDVQDALYAGVLCALCFSGLFAMERRGGMDVVLRCTPRGRRHTVHAKLLQCAILAAAVAAAVCLPHLWQILRDYGLPALFAPAMSIPEFADLPAFVTLAGVLVFWFFCRAAACMLLGMAALCMGYCLRNTLMSIMVCTALFTLPLVLSLSGMKGGIEWLSTWPLFHAAALLAPQPYGGYPLAWIPVLLLGLACVAIWAMAQRLLLCCNEA